VAPDESAIAHVVQPGGETRYLLVENLDGSGHVVIVKQTDNYGDTAFAWRPEPAP
jgi:hypothetical protein